jgi:hypothetical protein
MTAPFARFTSIHSGQPIWVDIESIYAILPVTEPAGTAVLVVEIGHDTMSFSVAEDSERAMEVISETIKNLEQA